MSPQVQTAESRDIYSTGREQKEGTLNAQRLSTSILARIARFSQYFNVASGTEFNGSFTVETETLPIFQSADAVMYRNVLTGATILVGPGGANGTYELGGVLVAGDTYSSQVLMIDDSTFGGNPPYDQFNLAGSLSPVLGDEADLRRSFSLSASSYTGQFFSTFPTLASMFDDVGAANPLLFTLGVYSHDEFGEPIAATLIANLTELRTPPAAVPEPATFSLFAAGLLGVLAARRGLRGANSSTTRRTP
jgi:hypothetical protein